MPRIVIRRENGAVVFDPSPLRIPKNSTVFWHNADSERHWISLCPAPVASTQNTDEVLITARQDYTCLDHPGETGSIEIEGTS
jgi:plastocyanin